MTGTLGSLSQGKEQTLAPSEEKLLEHYQLVNFQLYWHGLNNRKSVSVVTACVLIPLVTIDNGLLHYNLFYGGCSVKAERC